MNYDDLMSGSESEQFYQALELRQVDAVLVPRPGSSGTPAPTSPPLAALRLLRVFQRIRVVGDALPGTPRRTQVYRNFPGEALVRIPGAGHGIGARPSHLMGKVAHILAWFEKHRGS